MAGHSKWANIKHRKARQDKARGKTFGKLIRAIESSAREAGTSDPELSASLALAVQKAKDADVPKDTIEKACKRGAGELDDGVAYESATYEGYAPGGVAVLVDILTDNRNRTASDVRSIFSKAGGSLSEPGAVSFLFTRRGQVLVDAGTGDEDAVMMAGLDAGLEDVEPSGDTVIAWCAPTDLADLRKALEGAGLAVVGAEAPMVPSVTIPLEDASSAGKVIRLIDALEDNDDVQEVFANFDIDDELMEQLDT
ncbi:MAG TPA: YebC/PmpR family DNA-binding transcriptional regulator [Nitriliruptoraceae bacterium]|nr:YebC/PmpR family DNA-binding transcriptional regulator [Nitriliruptoraceae bacterium]